MRCACRANRAKGQQAGATLPSHPSRKQAVAAAAVYRAAPNSLVARKGLRSLLTLQSMHKKGPLRMSSSLLSPFFSPPLPSSSSAGDAPELSRAVCSCSCTQPTHHLHPTSVLPLSVGGARELPQAVRSRAHKPLLFPHFTFPDCTLSILSSDCRWCARATSSSVVASQGCTQPTHPFTRPDASHLSAGGARELPQAVRTFKSSQTTPLPALHLP